MTSPTRPRPASATGTGLRRPAERSGDLALVAVFAALVCALALTPGIPIGVLAIPITLQTLGIMLCGALLGPWRGAAAAALYLVVGFAGVPVFAGGAAGLGVLAGPSAGFLLSYPFAAFVMGLIARAGVRRGRSVLGLVAGTLLGGIGVVYAFGIPGMVLERRPGLGHGGEALPGLRAGRPRQGGPRRPRRRPRAPRVPPPHRPLRWAPVRDPPGGGARRGG